LRGIISYYNREDVPAHLKVWFSYLVLNILIELHSLPNPVVVVVLVVEKHKPSLVLAVEQHKPSLVLVVEYLTLEQTSALLERVVSWQVERMVVCVLMAEKEDEEMLLDIPKTNSFDPKKKETSRLKFNKLYRYMF
jgi:hypothetical protein